MNLTFEILGPCPVPQRDDNDPRCVRVIEIAGRLAACDRRFAKWARRVGVAVGSVTSPAQQADLEAELDALVARLYGLTEGQLQHVFATFHRGWKYEARLIAVLEHFDKIATTT